MRTIKSTRGGVSWVDGRGGVGWEGGWQEVDRQDMSGRTRGQYQLSKTTRDVPSHTTLAVWSVLFQTAAAATATVAVRWHEDDGLTAVTGSMQVFWHRDWGEREQETVTTRRQQITTIECVVLIGIQWQLISYTLLRTIKVKSLEFRLDSSISL